jgi:hypothetical protein
VRLVLFDQFVIEQLLAKVRGVWGPGNRFAALSGVQLGFMLSLLRCLMVQLAHDSTKRNWMKGVQESDKREKIQSIKRLVSAS